MPLSKDSKYVCQIIRGTWQDILTGWGFRLLVSTQGTVLAVFRLQKPYPESPAGLERRSEGLLMVPRKSMPW